MLTVPRTRCPYCTYVLQPWRGRRLVGLCRECRRPLALLPAITNPRVFRVWNVFSAIYVAALPVIGGAIVSTAIGGLPPHKLLLVITIMLLLWGAIDLWEGYAGVRTRITRKGTKLFEGASARRFSVLRIVAGSASLLMGVTGAAICVLRP
jgi:hypothetical protein